VGISISPLDDSVIVDGVLTLDADSVSVPAAADGDTDTAARTTDFDSATGQVQVNGAEVGDTGWRDISSLLSTGWTVGASGVFQIRRSGDVVHLHARNLQYSSGGSATLIAGSSALAGFAPASTHQFLYSLSALAVDTTTANVGQGYFSAGATPSCVIGGLLDGVTWSTTFTATAAWPATLPGTAA